MIVDYPKKSEKLGTASGGPSYGAGDKFPDNMESIQRYPRAEGMEHSDETRRERGEPSNQNPVGYNVCEYPRHDNGKTIDPYDPTVPATREGDTLDRRGRKADE
jgi:hypothetical protein